MAATSSFTMPAASSVPGVSSTVMPSVSGVTYAAAPVTSTSSTILPAVTSFGAITYGAAPAVASLPSASSVVVSSGSNLVYSAAPIANYSAAPAAPATYTISPERFQMILAGQPLAPEEIVAMTTAPQASSMVIPAASAVVADDSKTRSVNLAENAAVAETATGLVQFLNESPFTVQADRVPDNTSGKEAFATLPIELTGSVPDSYKPGDKIIMPSPGGDIEIDAPLDTKPGAAVRYRLAPTAELRVQVPPGRQSGELVKFKRADGLEIEVPVPAGLQPGDYFDADPPAVMVRVPDNTGPGEAVVFKGLRRDGQEATEWCRAVVPENVAPGKFFAARLPPPLKPGTTAKADSKKGSKKKMSSKKKTKGCC